VICSDRVGSAPDLVAERPWGRVHRAGDAESLAKAIASLATTPPQDRQPPPADQLPHPQDLVRAIQGQLRRL
jgi:hypothetical protein